MYESPPEEEVQLEDFEMYAIERQQVLRQVEEAKERGIKGQEFGKFVETACNKHGLSRQSRDSNKDVIGHFILRLAYCRTEDLRRWFLTQESNLFKVRFEAMGVDEQLAFVRFNNINVEQISEEEFAQNQQMLLDMHEGVTLREHFWKVPFEDVVDLVAQRRVLLQKGNAFVPSSQLSSIVVGRFRSALSKALAVTHKAMPAVESEEQYGAFLKSIGTMYFGPSYSSGASEHGTIDINDLDMLAQRSFPLCMQHMHKKLRENHHLKHSGRLTYGLFLKGIGLKLEDAIRFWRAEFTKTMPADKFDKEYAYGIRYNYGKEGKRTNYTPYGCMKIIHSAPATGDYHGCPFRHFDSEQLTATLRKNGVNSGNIAELNELVKNHHYQVACKRYYSFMHGNADAGRAGTHPNSYFSESMEHFKEKDAKDAGKKDVAMKPADGKAQ
jgi:DNA primase large subunit